MTGRTMMTPKEAANYLGVSVSMVYQLCDERRLAHTRIGGKGRRGKILISSRDCDALLNANRVDAR
jgi:excisionase family DNA binding protein